MDHVLGKKLSSRMDYCNLKPEVKASVVKEHKISTRQDDVKAKDI